MNNVFRLMLMGMLVAMTMGSMGCDTDTHSDTVSEETQITTTGTR